MALIFFAALALAQERPSLEPGCGPTRVEPPSLDVVMPECRYRFYRAAAVYALTLEELRRVDAMRLQSLEERAAALLAERRAGRRRRAVGAVAVGAVAVGVAVVALR